MASTGSTIDTDCKLLLHFDGTDGSTTFTDSEINTPKTVTANGNAQIDTAQSVFGGASGLFDGTADYLTAADSADWDLGSGNFTIDGRMRLADVGNVVSTLCAQYDSGVGTNKAFDIDWVGFGANILRFLYSTDGITPVTTKTVAWSPTVNTWYHVAVVRNGNNLYFFVDGTQQGSTQDVTGVTIFDVTTLFSVGALASADNSMNGWIDEFRFVKGTAVWTANFTPPTAAYTGPYTPKHLALLGVG